MPVSNASDALPPNSTACAISRHELDGHVTVVSVAGELDLSSAPKLRWVLASVLDENVSQVVLDLSSVTFLDSTALGVLVGAKRRLNDGAQLAIVCADANVLGVFKLTGLLGMFEPFPTLELALRSARRDTTEAR